MASDSLTFITAIIGAVSDVTGTVLGVIGTWHQLRRNQVRLKIIPKHIIHVGSIENAPLNFGIEVINLSEFAVTVDDVGFLLTGGSHGTLASIQGLESNGKLPLRLEPRSSYSKLFWINKEFIDWSKTRCAYATTQCGVEATGTSGALKQVIREGTGHGK